MHRRRDAASTANIWPPTGEPTRPALLLDAPCVTAVTPLGLKPSQANDEGKEKVVSVGGSAAETCLLVSHAKVV